MVIKINDIPPEGLALELEQKFDLFDEGAATTPFKAVLTIKPAGSGIFHVEGKVEATPELECSRCLKRFTFPVKETSMSFDLIQEGSLKMAAEHELNRSELDVEFYRGEEIKPLDFIREQVLLAVPMVPVHSQDCKGLCPVCGTDLNIENCGCKRDMAGETNPFSVLKNILKPQKE